MCENFVDEEQKTRHQHYVGEVQWLAQTTHIGIATAASIIGKYNAKPTPTCLKLDKQMMRYLKSTLGRKLVSKVFNKDGYKIYVEADWMGLHSVTGDLRSRIGIVILYNGMPIAWRSTWIKVKVGSSGEAEIYALAEAVKLALHFKYIGEELGIPMPDCPEIFCDATVALGFANECAGIGKMKHIDLRSGWVQDLRNNKTIKTKVPTEDNDADFLTKIHPTPTFNRFQDKLMPMTGIQCGAAAEGEDTETTEKQPSGQEDIIGK